MDCQGISQLLENGFTLTQAIELLQTSQNQRCFSYLKRALAQGEEISDCFGKIIALPLASSFSSFVRFLSLNEALSLSLRLYENQKRLKQTAGQKLLYPFCMLSFSCIGLLVFNQMILPSLLSLMADFDSQPNWIIAFHRISRFVIPFMFCLLIGFGVIVMIFSQKKYQAMVYIFCHKSRIFRLLPQLATHQFALFFHECVRRGYKTQQCLSLLQSLKQYPILVLLSYHIEQSLLQGNCLQEAIQIPYCDANLVKFMKIAIYGSNLEAMLQGYLEVSEQNFNRKIKRAVQAIQIFSYSCIGLIACMIYQILLVPLSMMGQL